MSLLVHLVSLFISFASDSKGRGVLVKFFIVSVALTCLCFAISFPIFYISYYGFSPPLSVDDFPGLENAYSDLIIDGYFEDVKLFQDGATWIDVYGYTHPRTEDKHFENHCKVLLEATNQYIPADKYSVRAVVLSTRGEQPLVYCNQRE